MISFLLALLKGICFIFNITESLCTGAPILKCVCVCVKDASGGVSGEHSKGGSGG